MKPQPTAPVPRIALTREEAAASLGMCLSSFKRHVQPELKIVRVGNARLIPATELEAWVRRRAQLAG